MSQKKNKGCLGRLFSLLLRIVLIAAVVVGATNLAVFKIGGDRFVTVEEAAEAVSDAQCILVLGASVLADGTPSDILQSRLDCAAELYFAGAAPKILVSGDNSTATYNEVLAMKNYLVSLGVPSEDIFCDHAGFSTYDSVYRAKYVFGADRMIIVTQSYHLYRAVYCANGLGIEVAGVASDQDEYEDQLWFELREVFARTKDFFVTLLELPSTYTGDSISLEGSGDEVE